MGAINCFVTDMRGNGGGHREITTDQKTIALLQTLGLTTYEATAYAALAWIGSTTPFALAGIDQMADECTMTCRKSTESGVSRRRSCKKRRAPGGMPAAYRFSPWVLLSPEADHVPVP